MAIVDGVADAVGISDGKSTSLEVVLTVAGLDGGIISTSEVFSVAFSVTWGGSGSSSIFDCSQWGQIQSRDLFESVSCQ
jgi:hypothetical protein